MPTAIDPLIISMALLRIISSIICLVVAALMFKSRNIRQTIKINALEAFAEPVVFVLVTFIGITGLIEEVSLTELLFVTLGVGFVFYGVME